MVAKCNKAVAGEQGGVAARHSIALSAVKRIISSWRGDDPAICEISRANVMGSAALSGIAPLGRVAPMISA
jgi:hypothetical protein